MRQADRNFDYVKYVEDWVKPSDTYRLLVNNNLNGSSTQSYDLIECKPPVSTDSALSNRKLCLNVYFDKNRDPSSVEKFTRNGQPMVFNCSSTNDNVSEPLKNVSVKIYFDLEKLLAEKLVKLPSNTTDINLNVNLNMPTGSTQKTRQEANETPSVLRIPSPQNYDVSNEISLKNVKQSPVE